MKTKILLSILMFLLLLIYSCGEKKNGLLNISLINSNSTNIELSSIAKNIEYIPLSKDILIGYIIKVVFDGSHFYISANNSQLLRFNKVGKFEIAIGRKGRGPGEYPLLGDFTVGQKTGIVYTLAQNKKVYKYNALGNFIGEINLSINYSTKIEEYDDTILVYNNGFRGNDQFNSELIDKNGNVIHRFFNSNKFMAGNQAIAFAGECLLYRNKNGLHLKDIYSDTVYCIKGSKKIPQYSFNSGENNLTPQMRENFNGDLEKFKNVILQSNLFETNRYLFYEYLFGGELQLLIYNKMTLENYKINGEKGFINDIDGGPDVIFKTAIGDNIVLTWYNAYELKSYVKSEAFKSSTPKYPEKKKQLEQLANSLDENDNPVLMLVKLKN